MYIDEDYWPPNFDRKWFCVGSIFCIWDYFAGCPTKCFPTLRQKYLIVSRQHLRKLHNRISSGSSLQDFPSHFLISWSTLKRPVSILREGNLPNSPQHTHFSLLIKKISEQKWNALPLPLQTRWTKELLLKVRGGCCCDVLPPFSPHSLFLPPPLKSQLRRWEGAANHPIMPLLYRWYTPY